MRNIIIAAAATIAAAAPAFADAPANDTITAVIAKGVTMNMQGMQIPIAYKADGTFSIEVQGQSINGKWRADGDKLCTTSEMRPEENCVAYPAGKKAGNSFDLSGPRGTVSVTINK